MLSGLRRIVRTRYFKKTDRHGNSNISPVKVIIVTYLDYKVATDIPSSRLYSRVNFTSTTGDNLRQHKNFGICGTSHVQIHCMQMHDHKPGGWGIFDHAKETAHVSFEQ